MNIEKFKYIKNTSKEEGVILLYNQIGDSVDENGNYVYGISGSSFAYEMQYLQGCCDKISVRINSAGGSVLDAYSIVSAIANSKVPCNTYIDGLAASSAAVIAVAGKKCYMASHAMLMIHDPSGVDDKKVLEMFKDSLVTILTARTAKSADEISAMMKKETWMNADEALENGMIDEIFTAEKKIKTPQKTSLQNLALVYNKLLNTQNMTKVTDLLKINSEANEDAIASAITSEIGKKDAEITTLKDRIVALEKEATDKADAIEKAAKLELTNSATELINKADAEKKFTSPEEKAEYLATASASKEGLKFVQNVLAKITGVKSGAKITNVAGVESSDTGAEDRSKWSFQDWTKNDPNGLLALENSAPEEFKKIINKLPKTLSPNFKPMPGVNC